MTTLQVATRQGIAGTIELADGRLTGSTPSLQEIADQVSQQQGSPEKGFAHLEGKYNGYVSYVRVPDQVRWRGPGHWRSAADDAQDGEPEEEPDPAVGLAQVRPSVRRERGRIEHVRGYVTRKRPRGEFIPADKWREGQRIWEQRGEAAWRVRDKHYPHIIESEARGNSRAVSPEEFRQLAREGNSIIDKMKRDKAPATGLEQNWGVVSDHAWNEVRKPWGGATIDAHTGQVLESTADKYALSVKPAKTPKVSVPEDASEKQFRTAMDHALETYRPVLERQSYYLGVFHDDDNHRIDFDPVVVVDTPDEVERIGAYAHSVGGAYHFKTGNGYFPPHVRAKDSLEKHTLPDGSIAPDRAVLHQHIIDGILAGHEPQAHPRATFYGGGPGSGKSTVLGSPRERSNSAVINSDDIKEKLPEYKRMRDAGDKSASVYVHEESSEIAKQAMREAMRRRINFTLDGTGDTSVEKMSDKVRRAQANGYTTSGRYVDVETPEAVKRATIRGQQTGRMVPESVIRATHTGVADTYTRAATNGLFDSTELWDNSGPIGSKPVLVAHQPEGGSFTVDHPALWERFKVKAAG